MDARIHLLQLLSGFRPGFAQLPQRRMGFQIAGYRGVLISNTIILGLLIGLFATVGADTPVWLIVTQVSAIIFRELKSDDGDAVSRGNAVQHLG